jgi:capsule polysaccharide export protein KpsE/RkpR
MNPALTPPITEPVPGESRAADGGEVSLIDLALVLARRLRLLVWLPLGVGVFVLGISFAMKPIFTASTKLLSPQQPSSTAAALLGSIGGAAGALGGSLAGLKNPADQWVGLLKSRVISDAIVKRFKLQALYETQYEFQARNALAGNSRITVGKDGLIDIEVDDESPERAAQMTVAYVEELQRLTNTLAITEASQRRLFFQRQLADAKAGLIKAEVALNEGGINANVLKTSPAAAVAQLAQAQAALAAQEVKLSVMRGSMTENNPEFKQAALELASLREQLRKTEQDKPGQAQGDAAQYVARYREFKYYETLFELFARQYELARADEAKDGALVQVVDPVLVPEYKSKPKRALMAVLATVLTFMATAIYVLVANGLDTYRRKPGGAAKLAQLRQSFSRARQP